MTPRIAPRMLALTACLTITALATSMAQAAPRGREEEKPRGERPPGRSEPEHKTENKPTGAQNKTAPGGEWSERTHSGKQNSGQQAGVQHKDAAVGAAASKSNTPQHSGAEGAAAGAAAANRNDPKATGAQGAAAGAAAANRNQPKATGAEGAAAGAAAANRNNPNVSGAAGVAAGAAAANRNHPPFSGAAGAAGYAAVRNSYNHTNLYGSQWYSAHPGVWMGAGLAAGAVWAPATWGSISNYCGYGAVTPISYDYGVNVVPQGGNVLVNGQSVGTTADFSQQAYDLAEVGAQANVSDSDSWLPLGVFAMVRNEQQQPQLVVQMAINKQGIVRGNYTDQVSDHTLPIQGAVDKQTQRLAWTVGDNKSTVMECGLNDLTDNEAPALIHKNGKTDHWLLIRLEQPK